MFEELCFGFLQFICVMYHKLQFISIKFLFGSYSDHYAFVTFYNMDDAFAAIDNGGKLRKPDELPFDICFGGRRQFCNSNYSDLGETKIREKINYFEKL